MATDRQPASAGILVVDDSPAALAALSALLKPVVSRLVLATSGREALRHVEYENFALALIDVQMPEMSGFELTRQIRRTSRGRVLPVMLMTALNCDEELISEGYAAGAADFVAKPFDPDVLRGRVLSFVELYERQEAVNSTLFAAATQERDEAVRRLLAFERISAAALETNDLQALLHELLRIFIAAADAADSAAILLREGDSLEVRAHVGFEGPTTARAHWGTGFAGKIAAEGAPLELGARDSGGTLELVELCSPGTRAIYGVPMIQAGEVLGVAQIGSNRADEFTDMEKRLFRAAADRAALAVARYVERSQLLTVLTAMPACVAIVRLPTLEYAFASPGYAALCGDDLVGEQLTRRGLGNEALQAVLHAVESGQTVHVDELGAFPPRADHKTEPLCFRFTAQPLRDIDGAVDRVLLFAVNITDQVLARQTIEVAQGERLALLEKEKKARLEAELASVNKDEFLTIVSHELRAPLTAMLGWAKAAGSLDDREHAFSIIERNARMQSRIVEDLLDFSRINRGKLRLDLESVDLAGIVRAAVDSLKSQAEEKGVVLEQRLTTLKPVTGDGDRLQQVIFNLLTNALKFTERGGRVEVSLERSAGGICLRVSDSGCGIDPDFLPQVFEPFRQADGTTTRRHRGLGLGLSIVKQIVQAHGGAVRAMSDGVGRGATFLVELPSDADGFVQNRRSGRHSATL